jgi:hypothetical protein
MQEQGQEETQMQEHYSILIDWLFSVCLEWNLEVQTWITSAFIVRLYLEKILVFTSNLQLVGCAALFLANRLNDYRLVCVNGKELQNASDDSCPEKEILKVAKDMHTLMLSMNTDEWMGSMG